MKTTRG